MAYGAFGYDPRPGSLVPFLATISPGMRVALQYDCQFPSFGINQGFQGGTLMLSNYNGFPGVVRIAPCSINAVSPFC